MATQADFYNLSMLPLPRLDDPTLPVAVARDKWNQQLTIVKAVQGAQVTLGVDFELALDNLCFYIQMALQQISDFYGRGGSGLEPAVQVEGLDAVRMMFMYELPRAKQLCAQWKAETADNANNEALGFFGAEPDQGTEFAQKVADLTKPPSESKTVAYLMILGGLWLTKIALFDK